MEDKMSVYRLRFTRNLVLLQQIEHVGLFKIDASIDQVMKWTVNDWMHYLYF